MVGNQSLRNGFIGSQHTGVLFWYEPFECLRSPNPGFIKQPLHTSYVDSCKNRRNSEVNFFWGSGWSTVNSCSSGVVRFSGYLYEFSLETLKGSQRRLQQLRESGETWDAVQEMISRTVHTMCLHIAMVYIRIHILYVIYLNLLHWIYANQCILCTSFIMILLACKWHIE